MSDGAQLFVRTSDVASVLAVIETYVREHGCGGRYEAVDDRIEMLTERRSSRTFAVSPPTHGWVTVWEDGVLADRRLAAAVSSSLGTSVRWLMLSSSTGLNASFAYENGEQIDNEGAAATERLPYAGVFLPDPTLGRYLAGLDVPALQQHGVSAEDMDAALADRPDPAPPGTERRTYDC
jgi:hypothetical protein